MIQVKFHAVDADASIVTSPPPQPSRAAAFTVVEVVIAVLILAVVVSGIALAAAGGSKLRGSAKLQAAMQAAGMKAQEDLTTDRSWMTRPECRSLVTPCDVSSAIRPDSLELDGISTKGLASTSMQIVSATSQALDSPVDRLGDQDADGVVPDFYRIDLVLSVPQSVASRYSTTSARLTRRLTTTIDRRGKQQEGSLAVEVCQVVNQSDERMSIQGCAESGSSAVKMTGCPPQPMPGCTRAFGWIAGMPQDDAAPSPYVVMHRVTGISFSVQNTTTGQTWSSGSASRDAGLFVFQNLPAGSYRINGLPDTIGHGTERWMTKELPEFHGSPSVAITGDSSAVVEPGLRNRALVLFRPSQSGRQISVFADREIHDYVLSGPYQATETVVAAGTPVDSYVGGGAADTCAYLIKQGALVGALFTCDPLEPSGPNCSNVYVSGSYYAKVPIGTGAYTMQVGGTGGLNALFVAAPALDGDYNLVPLVHRLFARYCATYMEQDTYQFWVGGDPSAPYYLPGAVDKVEYTITPTPDNRVIDVSGIDSIVPKAHCTIPAKRKQCTTSFTDLVPGLNTDVVANDAKAAAKNDNLIKMPAWMTAGALWVRPDGAIDSPAGSVGPNPSVHIRGKGECYWISTRWGGGKVEGPCNSCKPVWEPGGKTVNGCSVLVGNDASLTVVESITSYDLMTGAVVSYNTHVIGTDDIHIDLPTAWGCSTRTPTLATCPPPAPPSGGGGGGGGGSSHKSSAGGGTASVGGSSGPGGGRGKGNGKA